MSSFSPKAVWKKALINTLKLASTWSDSNRWECWFLPLLVEESSLTTKHLEGSWPDSKCLMYFIALMLKIAVSLFYQKHGWKHGNSQFVLFSLYRPAPHWIICHVDLFGSSKHFKAPEDAKRVLDPKASPVRPEVTWSIPGEILWWAEILFRSLILQAHLNIGWMYRDASKEINKSDPILYGLQVTDKTSSMATWMFHLGLHHFLLCKRMISSFWSKSTTHTAIWTGNFI